MGHTSFAAEDRVRSRRWRGLSMVIAIAALAATACQPGAPARTSTTAVASAAPAASGDGSLWISPAEIARIPASGETWNNLVMVANRDWGTASLSDNNSFHDTSTLAGALVAARTGNTAMLAKTRAAITSVTRITTYERVLELSRNVPSYVIAADIVGLSPSDDARFKAFISALRYLPLQGHSAGTDLYSTALRSPANWGGMARAAMTSIDLYLGDRQQLNQIALAHRAWLGENVPNQLVFTDTAWHAGGRKMGINPRGSVVAGRNADGVEPEDQRRSGEPTADPAPKGSYPWEVMQGALVTGVMLDRAGVVDINAGDQALIRAFTWLFETNQNPALNDDRWQPWLLNSVAGTHFPTVASTPYPGKNMGWTDWTHTVRR